MSLESKLTDRGGSEARSFLPPGTAQWSFRSQLDEQPRKQLELQNNLDYKKAIGMGTLFKIKRKIFRWLPDTNLVNLIYSEIGYFCHFGRFANVRRPRCFNEHLMRLKCSNEMRRPLRTFVSDKELV